MLEEILPAKDCEIEKMKIADDHIHIFTSTPPRYFVGQMVRVLKIMNATEILLAYPEVEHQDTGR